MKKLLFILAAFFFAQTLMAFNASNNFFVNSDFKRDEFSITGAVTETLGLGLDASYTNHDHYKDDIYSFALPVSYRSQYFNTIIRPFYTLKSNDDLYAFGINANLLLNLITDTQEDRYTQAFLSVSFANQKADLLLDNGAASREMYKEMVYTLGFRSNLFNSFFFSISGSMFQYPDGVSRVKAIGSVMDQQELTNFYTYDMITNLPKASAGINFSRKFESSAILYFSYNYIDYHTTDADHSFIIGNEFPIVNKLSGDFAYNHIRAMGGPKRDIYKIGLIYKF